MYAGVGAVGTRTRDVPETADGGRFAHALQRYSGHSLVVGLNEAPLLVEPRYAEHPRARVALDDHSAFNVISQHRPTTLLVAGIQYQPFPGAILGCLGRPE